MTDHAVTGLAILATIIVVAPLVAIFAYLIYKGASSLNLDFFTKVPKPPGEVGGGMANAIVGSGSCWDCQPHRHSHWHRRRDLPGRIRPRNQAGQRDSLYRGRAQRRALDRDGRRRLRFDCQPA